MLQYTVQIIESMRCMTIYLIELYKNIYVVDYDIQGHRI